ncbi:hypothetical protein CDV36_003084 [Fusarium kuroshium]|uniref:SNF2 N-terminal domain-containing protein n=1 Tax=Fusarium kuroshium TaxID=2010991 RepID=A0A3M2SI65_9HYPO|nr:hypothetical protein CDV36_003084 [Fusarium kuroshium]
MRGHYAASVLLIFISDKPEAVEETTGLRYRTNARSGADPDLVSLGLWFRLAAPDSLNIPCFYMTTFASEVFTAPTPITYQKTPLNIYISTPHHFTYHPEPRHDRKLAANALSPSQGMTKEGLKLAARSDFRGCVLSDAVGLGKALAALTALLKLPEEHVQMNPTAIP